MNLFSINVYTCIRYFHLDVKTDTVHIDNRNILCPHIHAKLNALFYTHTYKCKTIESKNMNFTFLKTLYFRKVNTVIRNFIFFSLEKSNAVTELEYENGCLQILVRTKIFHVSSYLTYNIETHTLCDVYRVYTHCKNLRILDRSRHAYQFNFKRSEESSRVSFDVGPAYRFKLFNHSVPH